MYVCMYVCTFVCVCVCACVHACMNVCMYVCMRVCSKYVCMNVENINLYAKVYVLCTAQLVTDRHVF